MNLSAPQAGRRQRRAGPASDTPDGWDFGAQGHRVVVNRLSGTPLSQAGVVGIHKGGDIRSTVRDDFNDRTYQNTVTGSLYYVDVK
ncbi:hypothetical protein [Mycolicibacterium austroafricanum]|uniref:hypothetical protein n=1 Tax=Mycolicibacterium austroafricanum TaxID=39687 RepID=UPI003AF3824B